MSKVIVGISLSTAAFISVLVGLSVCALCLTLSCDESPAPKDSVVINPLPPLGPSGSIGSSKEAELERQFGKVDKSKLNEVKQGIFSRIAQRRQSRSVQLCVDCPQSYQAVYYVPTYRRVTVPSYYTPYIPAVSTPSVQPLVVPDEPMPEIDESTCQDGSCALKNQATMPTLNVWW